MGKWPEGIWNKEAVISILFPRRCPVCGEIAEPKGEKICPECRKKLSFVSGPWCLKCGKELETKDAEYCLGCRKGKRSFEFGAALLNYNEISARSMAQIKYQNRREYLDYYSEEMVRRLGHRISRMKAQILVPVPVHPARKRQRGYNQAEELRCGWGSLQAFRFVHRLWCASKRLRPRKN